MLVLEHFLYSWQRELVAVVVVFLTDLKVLETLAFALMQMMTAFLAKWLVSLVGGWTVERRATFYALHFVVLRGGWHVVLIFGMLCVICFAIDFRFLIVDVFTSALVVIEFHVDVVVGINAHAVDDVAVDGFRKFCEMSVLVEHICVNVEATIV